MKYIWFRRPDGRWNADCTCGASICGIRFEERAMFEDAHLEVVAKDRARGIHRTPCGPKFPDANVHMPGPLVFA